MEEEKKVESIRLFTNRNATISLAWRWHHPPIKIVSEIGIFLLGFFQPCLCTVYAYYTSRDTLEIFEQRVSTRGRFMTDEGLTGGKIIRGLGQGFVLDVRLLVH